MRHLVRYMRKLNQRRMTAFYLLPQNSNEKQPTSSGQLHFEHFAPTADRPRTLRELFSDTEYENEDDLS